MSTKTSESVTVTTTTSTMPSLAINSGVLKTPSVCLKILETIIGAIGFGMAMSESSKEESERLETLEMRFLALFIFTFLIATFLLLVSSLVSSMAANMIPKTIFEFLYHFSASIAYLVTTLCFILHFYSTKMFEFRDDETTAMSVLGIVNGLLYCVSTFISYKSYRAS